MSLSYVLITPALNEEAFIEETIRAVIAQTITPTRWVIVNDGSTDRTDAIVRPYTASHPWIELLTLPPRSSRDFAGKARAFVAGHQSVAGLDYEVIGNLDADITFAPNYIENLLNHFEADPTLGVAGSPFRENNVQYDIRFSRKEHVSGACQLFRRECFEAIGGYVPLHPGGIDLIAVVTARMKGWKTESFHDQYCVHHRVMGSVNDRLVARQFKSGYGDYLLGVHPLWQFSRCMYQMTRPPRVIAGSMLLAGYTWALVVRARKPVSEEFVRFRHQEQMRNLAGYVKQWLGLQKRSPATEALVGERPSRTS